MGVLFRLHDAPIGGRIYYLEIEIMKHNKFKRPDEFEEVVRRAPKELIKKIRMSMLRAYGESDSVKPNPALLKAIENLETNPKLFNNVNPIWKEIITEEIRKNTNKEN